MLKRTMPLLLAILLPTSCGAEPKNVQQPEEQAPARPEIVVEGGSETVEGLFVDLTVGLNEASKEAIVSALPPPALLADIIVCPEGDALADKLETMIADLDGVMAMLAQASLTMEFSEILLKEDSIRTYAAGESLGNGCTAGMHLTFANVEASFFLTLQGKTSEQTMLFMVMRVGEDGPWFLAGKP